MIECQAQRHEIARLDAVADHRRLAHDAANAEDRALRQVDDRREGVDAEHAEVGDRKGRVAHLVGPKPAGAGLGEHGRNFVQTLAEARRLDCLPEIAALFDVYKDEAEGIADVTVTSAAPLDARQQQSLTAALARRLKREVRLHCTIDPDLIGGAVLRSGDLVIDGSVRGRLERIANELVA